MNVSKQQEIKKMKVKKSHVRFIYSFMLNLYSRESETGTGDAQTKNKLPLQQLLKVLQKQESINGQKNDLAAQEWKGVFQNENKDAGWKSVKPSERIGVTTNLQIDGKNKTLYYYGKPVQKFKLTPNSRYRDCNDTLPESLRKEKPFLVNLEYLLRINDNGSGTLTLSVDLNKDRQSKSKSNFSYSAIDIHKVYNLIPINSDKEPMYQLTLVGKGRNKTSKPFFELFENILKVRVLDPCKNSQMQDIWLDPIAISDADSSQVSEESTERNRDWQNPFTMTEIELDEDLPRMGGFWTETQTDANDMRCQELFTLISRMLKGKQLLEKEETEYLPLSESTNRIRLPHNYSWHNDVYIGFHGRGGIVVYYKNPREASLVPELTESYLDLTEILRARWHLCVVFSELISHDLGEINKLDLKNLWMFTNILLQRRELYIRFLSDPTMYAFEGGVVARICQDARSIFSVDELSEIVSNKFIALEKYYKERVDWMILTSRMGDQKQ